LFAPGAILQSTIPGGGLGPSAGTSTATPVVAGAVALVQQASMTFSGRYLAPAAVRQLLQGTAVPVVGGDDEDFNGRPTGATCPRLNLYNAVRQVRGPITTPGNPPPGYTDPTGTPPGAVVVPPLTGGEEFGYPGDIGTDGDVVVGPTDVDLYCFQVLEEGDVT